MAGAGRHLTVDGHRIWVVDTPSADPTSGREPLLYLHGFPTSSLDLDPVVAALSAARRVVSFDFLGFGRSDKPDRPYTMGLQADVTMAVCDELRLDRVALMSHDMGDTVGGELLARHAEGAWDVEITRRVVTNGSIYIDLAQLTDEQQLLLSLPDEALPAGFARPAADIAGSLHRTLSPTTAVSVDEMLPHAELVLASEGTRIMPRLIRYIEERRANERRFTGAIETHPSPLSIIWGTDDPIAVTAMSAQLHSARPDASLTLLDGVGHYPMIEAPDRFAAAVLTALDG